MKKIIIILSSIFFATFINSCDDTSCDDVLCGLNQNCISGNCYCADGYEGESCIELAYEKYIRSYNISKSCEQGNGGFGFTTFGNIQADGSPINELLFFNFLGLGQTAYAYIATDQTGKGNYLRFPSQNIGSAEIVGEGFYEDYGTYGRLRLEIQLTTNQSISKCTYTYH